MLIKNELEAIVKTAFMACGYGDDLGHVSESKRPDLCQFQSNDVFAVAKKNKLNPKEIGEKVVTVLSQDKRIKEAAFVLPGFINITLSDDFLLDTLMTMVSDEKLGVEQAGFGKKLVLDYGGPNVAKPLHVGHLRSAIIGESIKRIAKTSAYEVIADIHLGDWGLPLGLVIHELQLRYPQWDVFQDDFVPPSQDIVINPELLYEIYPLASKKSKEDADYLQKARTVTAFLQAGHLGYRTLWQEVVAKSCEDIKKDYDTLNVSFDLWYGESDADSAIPRLMRILEDKNLLRESEGAKVVDVLLDSDKSPMPPVIVEKSDGSSIYATTDLATVVQRMEDFNPDAIWYFADNRQSLHYEQFFRVAKLAGMVPADFDFSFLGFGTMNGPDGKPFKTRDGGVPSLSYLLQLAKETAQRKLAESDRNVKEQDAEVIGVAALKFGDLINHPQSNYIFDIDKFLAFEGKTGNYILYNNVRILSILDKLKEDRHQIKRPEAIHSESERQLILRILRNPEQFRLALEEKAPSFVTENTYQIATMLAKFYAENNVIQQENKKIQTDWINLLKITHRFLVFNLDNLAIDTVEEM